jgi:hypothetical protein
MKATDQVGITFANTVVGRGIFNNVVNVQLAAFAWSSTDDGKVEPDPVITCRLRLDLACATQLRDALDELLALVDKTKAAPPAGVAVNGDASHAPEGKPN